MERRKVSSMGAFVGADATTDRTARPVVLHHMMSPTENPNRFLYWMSWWMTWFVGPWVMAILPLESLSIGVFKYDKGCYRFKLYEAQWRKKV